MAYYTATKSRARDRGGWSVIFRHPARVDATGKAGRRVRRGLGTPDEVAATALIEQLNEILRTEELWSSAAREQASHRFDPKVVDIFYDGLEATTTDFAALRDELLPLPAVADGYRRVLILGTTGAGKTTVVRQLLGTDPEAERFPSTSTAKTTVADMELFPADGDSFKAVVTFSPRDEVIDYLCENISAAALAIRRERGDEEVLRRMLDHVNQRFRFSYILGRGTAPDDDIDDDLDDETDDEIDPADYGDIDLQATNAAIAEALSKLKLLVEQHSSFISQVFQDVDGDERVIEELIEESLDTEFRHSEEFHAITDLLVDEIEKRFGALDTGTTRKTRQGWPTVWTFESTRREEFIRTINRFSSNRAQLFGRLLTPLVNGIRVSGPFIPVWADAAPRLVLIDGEGLGHTPSSAATLSTKVAEQLDAVDSILLTDNAAQPMQAAPVAALKSITVSGNAAKVCFLFTHFDQVGGDNLRGARARENHVLASAENVLKSIGDELGPAAERVLRKQIDNAKFFVGGIQDPLDAQKNSGKRSIAQLRNLIDWIEGGGPQMTAGPSVPVYDRMNLSLAVTEAAKAFHSRWRGLLGIEANVDAPKEHWTRIKALSRRLAEGWTDQYDYLQPAADLRNQLQIQVYLMLQKPVRWEGGEPSDDEKQAVLDAMSNSLLKRLLEVSRRRIVEDVRPNWQHAYAQSGSGSTFVRARIIDSEIYDRGAPIPAVTASPDQNRFLKDVAAQLTAVAEEHGVKLE